MSPLRIQWQGAPSAMTAHLNRHGRMRHNDRGSAALNSADPSGLSRDTKYWATTGMVRSDQLQLPSSEDGHRSDLFPLVQIELWKKEPHATSLPA